MTPFIRSAFLATTVASVLLAALIATPAQAQSAPSAPTAVCPDASAQLEELLASAAQRVDAVGEVQARFEVDAQGRVRDIAVDGHRAYATRVRLALPALACQGGVPQGYRLTIRFAPGQPASAASMAVAATAPR